MMPVSVRPKRLFPPKRAQPLCALPVRISVPGFSLPLPTAYHSVCSKKQGPLKERGPCLFSVSNVALFHPCSGRSNGPHSSTQVPSPEIIRMVARFRSSELLPKRCCERIHKSCFFPNSQQVEDSRMGGRHMADCQITQEFIALKAKQDTPPQVIRGGVSCLGRKAQIEFKI